MDAWEDRQVYLCPRCLEVYDSPGVCKRDGTALFTCRPGDPNDPCRRPLMDADGRLITRAPVWWLRHSVGDLIRKIDESQDR